MSDLIDRKAVIGLAKDICVPTKDGSKYRHRSIDPIDVMELPSAEPEEFEWCHDCKEYDQEQHCCHRWTKVIRQTVEELKAHEPERTAKAEYSNIDGEYLCNECGRVVQIEDAYCCGCGCRLGWK